MSVLIPTVMQTKVPWYLNTFYPVFAVGLALSFARGLAVATNSAVPRWRLACLVSAFVVALSVAEGKLLYYSFHYRDVRLSRQSLMLAEQHQLRGHRLFLEPHNRAGHFVAEAMIGATAQPVTDRATFLRESREGDYLLTADPCQMPELDLVRSSGGQFLCKRLATDR